MTQTSMPIWDRDNADVNLDFVLGFLCSLIWVCDGSGSFFLISSDLGFWVVDGVD